MTMHSSRRTVLTAAVAVAAAAGTGAASAAPALAAPAAKAAGSRPGRATGSLVDNAFWAGHQDWRAGTGHGVRSVPGPVAGLVIDKAVGRTDYQDPHTGTTATWEYATWTGPVHHSSVPATEIVAHWNADTPAGTWLQVELQGRYSDGTLTPWYVMGRWTAGDGDTDIRRTSLDGQADGRSSISTDTFALDDEAGTLRVPSYQLRLTLYRSPGSRLTPLVRRLGAMASAVPARFTVPASKPGTARELRVPAYSQDIHKGQYPQYDNGGEAWCSPTSSSMVLDYWGHGPTRAETAWVDPSYADPQVDHAARCTYDYQYEGCGNWPFNAAYAASRGMNAAVTRLGSLTDIETLVAAGIPVITSQSFLASELTGAGYGTSGHLMAIAGFTADGDVVANDPASQDDAAVRNVYKRAEFETIWLRTKRYNATGGVSSGSGGVVYVYWPPRPTKAQERALKSFGLL
ncbi:peptidase C39 family protein [Streptomyces fuscigenes]|uniref:peptidase C39 family protein n=1 Tax=Streptomyces fuscigenes TaxID=1528880 RepID=UPI001F3CB577|nr:peptidase C39 family protein [Streptomyces fuscigenes]MCF3961841.1 peptidase C39 family protein [Streptomyces fuscigenes]